MIFKKETGGKISGELAEIVTINVARMATKHLHLTRFLNDFTTLLGKIRV